VARTILKARDLQFWSEPPFFGKKNDYGMLV